jgi:hypothetical protein
MTQITGLGVMGNRACNCNASYNKRSTKHPYVSGSCLTDNPLKIHTNTVTDNTSVNFYYYFHVYSENIYEVFLGGDLFVNLCHVLMNIMRKILETYNLPKEQ